jgi:XRE family aerobic/anaerobic benzoate catabolism transcriptional regulator
MAQRPLAKRTAEAASADQAYLAGLGDRVREMRTRRGMTRKILARDSGVSERYLGELEAGRGNISVMLLRQLADALDTPLERLVQEGPEPPLELAHSMELLRRLSPDELAKAQRLLLERFGGIESSSRRRRIALIGLRGAGKSTLGAMLAERMACPFVELDKEIEAEAGASLAAIFDLYGQGGFRRLERHCLQRIITQNSRTVIATGGGIVSDPATFQRLLAGCWTIWIRAAPTEHMQRVIAQGDMRPMADNRQAMADLQGILRTREALYAKADAQVQTSGRSLDEALDLLVTAAGG